MPKCSKYLFTMAFIFSVWASGLTIATGQAADSKPKSSPRKKSSSQAGDSGTFASGKNGAVATGSRAAASAGLEILKADGNAIDAAVATLLVQSVVEARLYCFGGEVPIIVYDAKRDVVEVLAGLGAAPQLATRDWFVKNRKSVIQGRNDIANAVVPGTLDACVTALDRYGSKTFSECAAPMLSILARRAAMDPGQVRVRGNGSAQKWVDHHKNFHDMITRLCDAEKKAGPDRKTGLRAVSDYFYRGPVARQISKWSEENGGLLRFSDFAKHHTRVENPLAIEFKGHTIYKCGVWTQGPFLHQTLKLVENQPLEKQGHHSEKYIHTVTEAMKLAFADRDAFYADPDFVEVPIKQLLSSQYTSMRQALLTPVASQEQQPGDPYNMKPLLGVAPRDHKVFSGHSDDTSNCLVADKWGNVVAATPSGWGGVQAGDSGVQLGSRMIGLTAWEGHPSVVAPGKRPRITLTPTLIMKSGKPVFAISVAGGDQQDQASIQITLNRLIFNFDTKASVQTPRFSTQHHLNWFGHLPVKPGTLAIPPGIDAAIANKLTERGHKISRSRTAGRSVVLSIDPETGEKAAACDIGKNAAAF